MKLLSLNCQKAYNQNLEQFLSDTLASEQYDFLLLQEATEKVLAHIRPFDTYKVLACEENGRPGLVCIVYRNTIALKSSQYALWPRLHSAEHSGKGHISFGVIAGVFAVHDRVMQIASVHLPSGVSAYRRHERLPESMRLLATPTHVHTTIFGGDCNFLHPSERARAERALSPEYVCVTGTLPATLNSCYTETLSDSVSYRIVTITAYLLRLLKICITFKTDHIFVDKGTVATKSIATRVLPDRVSDHSPIELVIDSEHG